MFKSILEEAIAEYLNTFFLEESNAAKVKIERTVKTATDPNALKKIAEVLAGVEPLDTWLKNHFTPGSFFIDRGWVFGWHSPEQLQAQRLPVKVSAGYFRGTFRKIEVIENRNGFRMAEALPYIDGYPVEIPPGKNHLFARHGWAAAVPLQWHRTGDGLIVDRTILGCGFAVAWKWWPAAWRFYNENPPSPLLTDCRLPDDPDRDFPHSDWRLL